MRRALGSGTPARSYKTSSGNKRPFADVESRPAGGIWTARDIGMSKRLRVTDSGVLRQEEPRKQRIDAEQSLTRQLDFFGCRRGDESLARQRLQLVFEPAKQVDAVFRSKVVGPHASE